MLLKATGIKSSMTYIIGIGCKWGGKNATLNTTKMEDGAIEMRTDSAFSFILIIIFA